MASDSESDSSDTSARRPLELLCGFLSHLSAKWFLFPQYMQRPFFFRRSFSSAVSRPLESSLPSKNFLPEVEEDEEADEVDAFLEEEDASDLEPEDFFLSESWEWEEPK